MFTKLQWYLNLKGFFSMQSFVKWMNKKMKRQIKNDKTTPQENMLTHTHTHTYKISENAYLVNSNGNVSGNIISHRLRGSAVVNFNGSVCVHKEIYHLEWLRVLMLTSANIWNSLLKSVLTKKPCHCVSQRKIGISSTSI